MYIFVCIVCLYQCVGAYCVKGSFQESAFSTKRVLGTTQVPWMGSKHLYSLSLMAGP